MIVSGQCYSLRPARERTCYPAVNGWPPRPVLRRPEAKESITDSFAPYRRPLRHIDDRALLVDIGRRKRICYRFLSLRPAEDWPPLMTGRRGDGEARPTSANTVCLKYCTADMIVLGGMSCPSAGAPTNLLSGY